MDNTVPKFSFDKTTKRFLITDGEYIGTMYKYIDIKTTNNEISYNVEFIDFYRFGGIIKNPDAEELQLFVDNAANSIVKSTLEAYTILKKNNLVT